jgi:hypothetical protein
MVLLLLHRQQQVQQVQQEGSKGLRPVVRLLAMRAGQLLLLLPPAGQQLASRKVSLQHSRTVLLLLLVLPLVLVLVLVLLAVGPLLLLRLLPV